MLFSIAIVLSKFLQKKCHFNGGRLVPGCLNRDRGCKYFCFRSPRCPASLWMSRGLRTVQALFFAE